MKCCAGIITYNPEVDKLINGLSSLYSQVDLIIIFDNGSVNIESLKLALQTYQEKLILIENENNIGIAGGLNKIFECAEKRKYEYVLTLDQDSFCPENLVEQLLKKVAEGVGIVCPLFRDRNTDIISSGNNNSSKCSEIEKCITSGSITTIQAWKEVHGFDEKMFIDFVDFDFCVRIRKCGYKIIQDNTVILEHEIGHSFSKKIFNRQIIVAEHSPSRNYYIVRNFIYYRKKNNIHDKAEMNAMLITIAKMIFFEEDHFKNIISILKGFEDACKMIYTLKGKSV